MSQWPRASVLAINKANIRHQLLLFGAFLSATLSLMLKFCQFLLPSSNLPKQLIQPLSRPCKWHTGHEWDWLHLFPVWACSWFCLLHLAYQLQVTLVTLNYQGSVCVTNSSVFNNSATFPPFLFYQYLRSSPGSRLGFTICFHLHYTYIYFFIHIYVIF